MVRTRFISAVLPGTSYPAPVRIHVASKALFVLFLILKNKIYFALVIYLLLFLLESAVNRIILSVRGPFGLHCRIHFVESESLNNEQLGAIFNFVVCLPVSHI